MDLTQLRTLIHVAELGSLSQAALRLRIAQPALSRQVRLLEEELGVRLFDRHGRGMVATEAGEEVLRHAHRVLAEVEELRWSVADPAAPLRGHVAPGMPPTVADILSVPLVTGFRARHPQATMRIVSGYSGHLLDWLQRGEIDLAILFEARPARSIRVEPLLEEPLHLVGPPGAGLGPGRPVPFDALADLTLLLPSQGQGLRTIVEEAARERGLALRIAVEADGYATLKALVRGGQGHTILPAAPLQEEIAAGLLEAAPLVDPVPVRRLGLAFPADRPVPRLARFVAESIRTISRDLVTGGIWAARSLGPPP